ncbi:MAG: GntR family transcriptional regulator [Leuconostoc gelidum]
MSLYQEIAKHLRQKIEDGNYQPGEALPRQTDLASEYNTSV